MLPATCGSSAYSSAVLADSPWAYWRLNEPSGTVAFDCSGYGRDATYQGGVTLGSGGQGVGFPSAATAPVFDGSTGYVLLPAIPTSSFGGPLFASFSIETWFESSSFTNNVRIFDLSHGTEADWIVLFFGSASTQAYILLDAGTNHYVFATAGPNLSLGAWYHVVLTQSAYAIAGGSSYFYSVSFYINGLQAATWTGSVSGYSDVARTVGYLGKSLHSPSDAFFSGTLAEAVRGNLAGGPLAGSWGFLALVIFALASGFFLTSFARLLVRCPFSCFPVSSLYAQAIYNYSLSAAQVSGHYLAGSTQLNVPPPSPPPPPLPR